MKTIKWDAFEYYRGLSSAKKVIILNKAWIYLEDFNHSIIKIVEYDLSFDSEFEKMVNALIDWSLIVLCDHLQSMTKFSRDFLIQSFNAFYKRGEKIDSESHLKAIDDYMESIRIILEKAIYEYFVRHYQEPYILHINQYPGLYLNEFGMCQSIQYKQWNYQVTHEKNNQGINGSKSSTIINFRMEDYARLEQMEKSSADVLIDVYDIYQLIGYLPLQRDIIEYFVRIKRVFQGVIYVIMPTSQHRESIPFFDVHLANSLILDHRYLEFYRDVFGAAHRVFGSAQTKIAFSGILVREDFNFLKLLYKTYCEKESIEISQVGIVIDGEEIVEHIETYAGVDFALFNLDHLSHDLLEEHVDDVDYAVFKKHFIEALRYAHAVLKIKKIYHAIKGEILRDDVILEKCMKMGFRHFYLSTEQLETYEKTRDSYMNRRGKYKKEKKS